MSKYHAAADLLKREAARYRGLSEAADALEEVGSLEQAAAEATAKRDRILAELSAAEAKLAQSHIEAERVNADLAENVVNSTEHAAQIVATAQATAAGITAEATQSADDIIQAGRETASAELAAKANEIATMQAKLTEVASQVEAAETARDNAQTETAAAESKLGAVLARVRRIAEGA